MNEHQLQSKFFVELKRCYPRIYKCTFAIPNGGWRHFLTAVKLKREGVKAGVPDVFVALPSKKHHGLFLEFKTKYNGLSSKQKSFFNLLTKNGYYCTVVRSVEEGLEIIKNYQSNKLFETNKAVH